MTLGQKQKIFAKLLSRLLDKAHALGFDVTLGDAYRDERLHGVMGVKLGYGHRNSCHKLRLAQDLNLFHGATFLTSTEDHHEIGVWWKLQGSAYGVETCWGGDFKRADGNHYSIEHNGNR